MTTFLKTLTLNLFLVCALANPALSAEMTSKAKQAIVIDDLTGQVLFEKNADERMPTSSMSKTMTIYAVFEALKDGKITLEDTFLVSEKAWKKGGSKMFVEVDKRVKIEDLIRGVIIQSGNDATIVLAEGLAGDESYFAEAITAKAHELGMTNTNFKNASGWPDPDHYSTARDLATLAHNIIHNFPEHYHYFSEKEFSYNEINQRNRNPLIYRDIGADGLKTGHTEVGGYGLIGSGVQDDRRVNIVINGLPDESGRAQESARLLEWGLRRFEHKTFFNAGDVVAQAAVVFGQDKTVDLRVNEDAIAAIPKMAIRDVQAQAIVNEPITAPITQGQELGSLHILIDDKIAMQYALYAAQDVKEKGFIGKTFEKIPYLFQQKQAQ